MTTQLVTRHDANVGEGIFDSIAWLYEVHLKEDDPGIYNSAVVHGNEDWPDKVEFYVSESPTIYDTPGRVWVPDVDLPH